MLLAGYIDPIWEDLKWWDTDRRPLFIRALESRASDPRLPKPMGFAVLPPEKRTEMARIGGAAARGRWSPPGVCGRCRRPLGAKTVERCGCPGNTSRPVSQ